MSWGNTVCDHRLLLWWDPNFSTMELTPRSLDSNLKVPWLYWLMGDQLITLSENNQLVPDYTFLWLSFYFNLLTFALNTKIQLHGVEHYKYIAMTSTQLWLIHSHWTPKPLLIVHLSFFWTQFCIIHSQLFGTCFW